jgi:exonuclease III
MDNTTIMSWNMQGLNDRARRDVVRKLVGNIRPSIVCLQETKLDVISQYLMFAMLGMSFADFAYLLASNRGGVLVTAREADISLSDVHVGCYSITVRVHPCAQVNGDEVSWWLTSVYRPQDDNNKILFHEELEAIRDACSGPWAVCRDFNLILSEADKNNARINHAKLSRFWRTVAELELQDLHLHGRCFT